VTAVRILAFFAQASLGVFVRNPLRGNDLELWHNGKPHETRFFVPKIACFGGRNARPSLENKTFVARPQYIIARIAGTNSCIGGPIIDVGKSNRTLRAAAAPRRNNRRMYVNSPTPKFHVPHSIPQTIRLCMLYFWPPVTMGFYTHCAQRKRNTEIEQAREVPCSSKSPRLASIACERSKPERKVDYQN
jgi:hypothetical protein